MKSSYSRDAETAYDAYGIALMNRIGGNAEALDALLARIDDLHGKGSSLFRDHPQTAERIVAIRSLAMPGSGRPLLDNTQWAALKNICARH